MTDRHLRQGDKLGGYVLESAVAQGGMAAVWLARDLETGDQVAVKTLLAEHATDPMFEAMLREESRITARIDHPNVARVLGWGETRGAPYLATEWVDGVSLATLHRLVGRATGGTIPLRLVLRAIADACSGLEAAHELLDERGMPAQLVHRDVSPSNVMIARDGQTKLIDFGIAKVRARSISPTAQGFVKGKVPFMAPEQAQGHFVDARTDIWAMAATAYYLIKGEVPVEAPDDQVRLHRLAQGAPIPRLPEPTPSAVADAIARALSFIPEDRFASAAAFGEALVTGDVATREELGAFVRACLPSSATTRRGSRRTERRSTALGVAAFALAASVAIGAYVYRAHRPDDAMAAQPAAAEPDVAPKAASPTASAGPLASSAPAGSTASAASSAAAASPAVAPAAHARNPVRASSAPRTTAPRATGTLPPYGAGKRDYGF